MIIKEKLLQEIESTPENLLSETLDFLRFLKTQQSHTEQETNSTSNQSELASSERVIDNPVNSTGRSILEHLKTIGTWHGDDFEECLKLVYATRSQAKFNKHINSFK